MQKYFYDIFIIKKTSYNRILKIQKRLTFYPNKLYGFKEIQYNL
jgi:hypothetical protein